jgi:hypothetical protein
MKVTRDVILDLWPVYESGAASEDTRTLVEEFLGSDPEFARRIREGEERMNDALMAVPVLPDPDAERAALARTQLLLRLRYYFLAFACFLTFFATTLRQYRTFTTVLAVLSAVAWVLVWMTARDPRLAALLPRPRVETRAQRVWSGLRTLALGVAVVFGLIAPMVHPRHRLGPTSLAFAGVVAWLALAAAEALTTRRR